MLGAGFICRFAGPLDSRAHTYNSLNTSQAAGTFDRRVLPDGIIAVRLTIKGRHVGSFMWFESSVGDNDRTEIFAARVHGSAMGKCLILAGSLSTERHPS